MNAEELDNLFFEPSFESSDSEDADSAAQILARTSKFSRRPQRFTPQFDALVDRQERVHTFFGVRVALEWTLNGRLWDSSVVLVRHLLAMRSDWTGVNVLELGSGVGLVGIVLAKHGASVTMTELAETLPRLRHNVALNDSTADVKELAWSATQPPAGEFTSRHWDFVIAADCLLPYDPPLLFALAATIGFVSAPATSVLIVFEERFDVSAFFAIAARDFVVTHVPADEWQRDDAEREPAIKLVQMQQRSV
jgi:predicted nicotinamide N-methyase